MGGPFLLSAQGFERQMLVVAGRVDGVEADEPRERVDGLRLQVHRRSVVSSRDPSAGASRRTACAEAA